MFMFEDGEGGSITWQPPPSVQKFIDELTTSEGEIETFRQYINVPLGMFHAMLCGTVLENDPIGMQSLQDHLVMAGRQAQARIQSKRS
jgi:hypothetical protein